MPDPSEPEDPDDSLRARPQDPAEPAAEITDLAAEPLESLEEQSPFAEEPPEASATGPDVADTDGAIRAGGGVVWSPWGERGVQIVLVHRPRYNDWTLPKGKAMPGESGAACALREVREETGLSCSLGEELVSTSYVDSKGRCKTVRYWAMEPIGGSFAPSDEVDEIRWMPLPEAVRLLTYERDVEVVNALTAPGGVPRAI